MSIGKRKPRVLLPARATGSVLECDLFQQRVCRWDLGTQSLQGRQRRTLLYGQKLFSRFASLIPALVSCARTTAEAVSV
jgi:hypothetical protein